MSDHEQCLVVVFVSWVCNLHLCSFRTSHLTMLMLNVTFSCMALEVLASECFERNILEVGYPFHPWKP